MLAPIGPLFSYGLLDDSSTEWGLSDLAEKTVKRFHVISNSFDTVQKSGECENDPVKPPDIIGVIKRKYHSYAFSSLAQRVNGRCAIFSFRIWCSYHWLSWRPRNSWILSLQWREQNCFLFFLHLRRRVCEMHKRRHPKGFTKALVDTVIGYDTFNFQFSARYPASRSECNGWIHKGDIFVHFSLLIGSSFESLNHRVVYLCFYSDDFFSDVNSPSSQGIFAQSGLGDVERMNKTNPRKITPHPKTGVQFNRYFFFPPKCDS